MVLQYLCSGSYFIHVLVYMNTSSQNFIVIQEHIICKIPQNFILKLKFFMFSFNNIKTMKDWNNPLFCVNKLINRSKFPNPFPQTNKNVRAGLLSLHKHFISFPKRRWKKCIIFTRKKKQWKKGVTLLSGAWNPMPVLVIWILVKILTCVEIQRNRQRRWFEFHGYMLPSISQISMTIKWPWALKSVSKS